MEFGLIALALLVGCISAIVGGALAGMKIGAEALGAQLSAYMGGLYGILSGFVATVIGVAILVVMQGGL